MDWRRERDGLVVVVVAVLVLGLLLSGRGAGIVATFLATFLGVLAAFRVESWLETDDDSEAVRGEPTGATPATTPRDDPPSGGRSGADPDDSPARTDVEVGDRDGV